MLNNLDQGSAPATNAVPEPDSRTDVPMQPASLDIWDKKYRLTDKTGTPIDQDIDDTLQRIALTLALVEEDKHEYWTTEFLWALHNGAIPAGRIVSNAGAQEFKHSTSLINCTVSGTLRDSMRSILERVVEAGLTLKSGAGIGYEFSTLRPKGAFVSGAGASTSGPLSFMDIYDKTCLTVSSAGGRRGAQMGTFDIGHPDVLDFIKAKRADGVLRQFNLSLLITDDFINAVKNDEEWPLAFPVMSAELDELNLEDPEQVIWREWPVHEEHYTIRDDGLVACKVYKRISAKKLFNVIMSSTYDFAEPGFILVDRVNDLNNNWFCEHIRATNPFQCGHASTGRGKSSLISWKSCRGRQGASKATTGLCSMND